MKKRVLIVALFIVGCVAIAKVFELQTSSNKELSFFAQNVEALTFDEGGTSSTWPCWSQSGGGSGEFWMCGNPCEKTAGRAKGSQGVCRSN